MNRPDERRDQRRTGQDEIKARGCPGAIRGDTADEALKLTDILAADQQHPRRATARRVI